jgi:hypothetical protein
MACSCLLLSSQFAKLGAHKQYLPTFSFNLTKTAIYLLFFVAQLNRASPHKHTIIVTERGDGRGGREDQIGMKAMAVHQAAARDVFPCDEPRGYACPSELPEALRKKHR